MFEQLAADLLPDPSEEQLMATGFHRNTMTNSEGGTNDEEFRNAAIVDRVNTTMAVWMGTSMACAGPVFLRNEANVNDFAGPTP